MDDGATHGLGESSSGSNQRGIRAHNERLVLTLIRKAGALPKAEIARRTGLSAQTVSVIMRSLERDGLLQKQDPVRGKVGQPSVPMSLDPDGAFFFGLMVGRRSATLILTDFLGAEHARRRLTYDMPVPDAIIAFAQGAIDRMTETLAPDHAERIAGLGIALPFRLWDWSGTSPEAAPGLDAWQDRDIATDLAAHMPYPVYLCNDGSAACNAELVFGTRHKPLDFLYFYIGHFVGGGLALDGTLYTGRTGNAAALGSTPLSVEPRTGRARQLVDVASLAALEDALAGSGLDSTALHTSADWSDLPAQVVENWLSGAANGLAQAIVSAACLIDFETVLIDGALPDTIRFDLVQRTGTQLAQIALRGIHPPRVREGTIGRGARALGAASLPLSERYLTDPKAFLLKG